MAPAGEPLGPRVALGTALGVGPYPATGDRLEHERHQAEDMFIVGIEVIGDREAAGN